MDNYLKQSINNLLTRIEYYNGFIMHIDSDIRNYPEILIERLNKQNINPDFLKGSRLIVSDLTGKEFNRKEYSPTKGYVVTRENYKEINNRLIQFISSILVAQSYEALETFLKDIITQYFKNNNQIAFETIGKANCIWNGNVVDWENTVRKIRPSDNNSRLLNIVRMLSADFKNAEIDNNQNINLVNWFKAISIIRHAITHAESIIDIKNWNKLNDDEQEILKSYITLEDLNNSEKRMLINKNQAQELMTIMSNYAIQIFKWLSISRGFEWDLKKIII